MKRFTIRCEKEDFGWVAFSSNLMDGEFVSTRGNVHHSPFSAARALAVRCGFDVDTWGLCRKRAHLGLSGNPNKSGVDMFELRPRIVPVYPLSSQIGSRFD